jgi:EpsI family protein
MNLAEHAWTRFCAAVVLLVSAAVFLGARSHPEPVPARQPLREFPLMLGDWTGSDVALQPESLNLLGAGDVLTRLYRRSYPGPPIDLLIAYFPSQRSGGTMHSPQNCLPGTGWAPLDHGYIALRGPGRKKVVVNRYLIGKGLDRDLVLYWYQSHGRVVANEYRAKVYLVADTIRSGRSDGSLVRVVTPVGGSEDVSAAVARAVTFAEGILPLLDNYIPKE